MIDDIRIAVAFVSGLVAGVLFDGTIYAVRWQSPANPTHAIVLLEWVKDSGWELYGGEVSDDEKDALRHLIDDSGTLDQTQVVMVPPGEEE